jgi:hypothetical protein
MDERMQRNALVVGAIVLALLSITGGALIAMSSDDRAGSPSVTPSDTPSDEPSAVPTESPEPSESETPEPSESPVLEDGHHFVYVTSASRSEDSTTEVTTEVEFDLAYFYTGVRAEQEAAERDDVATDGYYIVNDNDRLRTLPLADEVEVAYIPESQCCDPQPWDIEAWIEAIGLSTNPSDYPGKNVPWWFTVEGGQITQIEQQYLP